MSHGLDQALDQLVGVLTASHPGWIRVVQWIGRLEEPDGTPAEADIRLNRVLVWDGSQVRAEYGKTLGLPSAVYAAVNDHTADVAWTQLRVVTDRDGAREVELVTDEPRRPEVGSATDPYWDQVHGYLDLHRAEVDALVQRLRAGGQLPEGPRAGGGTAPAGDQGRADDRRKGVLGYFRRG